MKTIHIFGGGTVQFVRNHLALCAPAYGSTARKLHEAVIEAGVPRYQTELHLTKMADHRSPLQTNDDVAGRLTHLLREPTTAAIVFNVALCDFTGQIGDVPSGKYAQRLQSREGQVSMDLLPAPKVLQLIKAQRPDVFVVGFKTTADVSVVCQVELAERQKAETGVDLVWANDTVTRHNLLLGDGPAILHRSREDMLTHLAQRLCQQLKEVA